MSYLPIDLAECGLVADNARPHLRKTKSAELSPCPSIGSLPELRRLSSLRTMQGLLGIDDDDDDNEKKRRQKGPKGRSNRSSSRSRSRSSNKRKSKSNRLSKTTTFDPTSNSNNVNSRWETCADGAPIPPQSPMQQQRDLPDGAPRCPRRVVRKESMGIVPKSSLMGRRTIGGAAAASHLPTIPRNGVSNDDAPKRPSRIIREGSKKDCYENNTNNILESMKQQQQQRSSAAEESNYCSNNSPVSVLDASINFESLQLSSSATFTQSSCMSSITLEASLRDIEEVSETSDFSRSATYHEGVAYSSPSKSNSHNTNSHRARTLEIVNLALDEFHQNRDGGGGANSPRRRGH